MPSKKLVFSVLPLLDNFDLNYLAELRDHGLEIIHYDVMDEFTKTRGFKTEHLLDLYRLGFKIHVHLMTKKLATHLVEFVQYPVNKISFHVEAIDDPKEMFRYIDFIKNHQIQVGLAFKFDTNMERYVELLKSVDYVTLMSVVPGLGGQKFNPMVFKNILQLTKLSQQHGFALLPIEFDGGISEIEIKELWHHGKFFVSGSSFHKLSLENKKRILNSVANGTFLENFRFN